MGDSADGACKLKKRSSSRVSFAHNVSPSCSHCSQLKNDVGPIFLHEA